MTMLQSSGSFFAYNPFLKALQTMTDLPLAEWLVRPADDKAASQGACCRRSQARLLISLGEIKMTNSLRCNS